MSLNEGPIRELQLLARDRALPGDHGVQKFLTLVSQSAATFIPFLRNVGIGLMSRTEDVAADNEKNLQRLDGFFRGLEIQSNMNATESIVRLTRHCIHQGLNPGDIVKVAGPAQSEVVAVLRLDGKMPKKEEPFPAMPQSVTPASHGPVIGGPASLPPSSYGPPPGSTPIKGPLAPHLPGKQQKKP